MDVGRDHLADGWRRAGGEGEAVAGAAIRQIVGIGGVASHAHLPDQERAARAGPVDGNLAPASRLADTDLQNRVPRQPQIGFLDDRDIDQGKRGLLAADAQGDIRGKIRKTRAHARRQIGGGQGAKRIIGS